MKQRYKIPPAIVEKCKDEPCFMVEIDVTCMEEVETRVKFINPMGYEMRGKIIEGYAKIIIESQRDKECHKWGTYEENLREF